MELQSTSVRSLQCLYIHVSILSLLLKKSFLDLIDWCPCNQLLSLVDDGIYYGVVLVRPKYGIWCGLPLRLCHLIWVYNLKEDDAIDDMRESY